MFKNGLYQWWILIQRPDRAEEEPEGIVHSAARPGLQVMILQCCIWNIYSICVAMNPNILHNLCVYKFHTFLFVKILNSWNVCRYVNVFTTTTTTTTKPKYEVEYIYCPLEH